VILPGFKPTGAKFDIGTGDLGDEKFRDQETLHRVSNVPGDYDTLDDAIAHSQRMVRNSFISQRTLINLGPGSHLIKKKYKEVAIENNIWPYFKVHEPIFLDGKRTRALLPDDGSEPVFSDEKPVAYLPKRDPRFLNITNSLQILGSEGMRTRVCGAWRFHAPDSTGWIKEMVLINQGDGVIFVQDGDWKFEGCMFAAAGRDTLAVHVLELAGSTMVYLEQCCIQTLFSGIPDSSWASWPPGFATQGDKHYPAAYNPCPQDGYASFGLSIRGSCKCNLFRCCMQGLLLGAAVQDLSEVTFDECVIRWNQNGILQTEASTAFIRRCNFTENVRGAIGLDSLLSREGTTIGMSHCDVEGELWSSEFQPANCNLHDNRVVPLSPSFLQGPGKIDKVDPDRQVYWVANFTEEEEYSLYKEKEDDPWAHVGDVYKWLTVKERMAPSCFRDPVKP